MDLNLFKADTEREIQGAWVDITFRGQKFRFKVARSGNPEFTRIFTKYKNSKIFANPDSDESIAHDQECLNRAFSQAILMDWDESMTMNGEPVKYSVEVAYEILKDPAFTELKNQLAVKAGDFDLYAEVQLETAEGN